jgi:hypothetical protein
LREEMERVVPMSFRVTAGGYGAGYDNSEPGRSGLDRAAQAMLEALGETRQAEFRDAAALKQVHALAKSAAVASYEAGAPFGPGQVDELANAMLRHGAKQVAVFGSPIPDAKAVVMDAVDWSTVKRELENSWSEPQLRAVDSVRNALEAKRRLESTMMKYPGPPRSDSR